MKSRQEERKRVGVRVLDTGVNLWIKARDKNDMKRNKNLTNMS